jgi:hypothetical protein
MRVRARSPYTSYSIVFRLPPEVTRLPPGKPQKPCRRRAAVAAVLQKIRAGLVELRTDLGPVYVNPSFWNRVYLLWTFRNFRSLPKQVLNRHEKDLVDRLCRAPIVSGTRPIARSCLIGAVENVRLMPDCRAEAAVATGKVIALGTIPADITPLAVGSEGISIRSSGAVYKRSDIDRFGQNADIRKISAFIPFPARQRRNWLVLALTGAVGVGLLGILLYLREGRVVSSATAPQAAIQIHKMLSGSAFVSPIAQNEKVRQSTQPEHRKPATMAAAKPLPHVSHRTTLIVNHPQDAMGPSPTERLQVAQAPQSGFGYPVAPNPTLTGKVSLRAVIGIDGTVRELVVLSGNPALASAAGRAVRHWQYRPQILNGHAVEAETKITISFVGDDTVSISFSTAY